MFKSKNKPNQSAINCLEINNKLNLIIDNIHLMNNSKYNSDRFSYEINQIRKNANSKVLIAGFFGAMNTGDELMLQSMLEYFDDNENVYIMLANNNYIIPSKYYKNKYIHYSNSILESEMIADTFDTIIWAGGAHIDDSKYNFIGNFSYAEMYTSISINMIKRNKKVISYGLSTVQELKNEKYIDDLTYIIENSTYFSLRDTLSSKTLEKTLNLKSKINVDSDLLICSKEIERAINTNTKKENYIVLINIYTQENYSENLKLINYILNNTEEDYKIKLLSFYNYCDNDEIYIRKIINELNSDRITYEPIITDIYDLSIFFKKSRFVISMRYHGILLSNLLNVKNLAILYDIHPHYYNKVHAMYEMYKFKENIYIYSQLLNNDMDYISRFINDKDKEKLSNEINYKEERKKINNIMEAV